jgi:putative FmdB family regulatory protein
VIPPPWPARPIVSALRLAGRISPVPRYEYRCRACGDTFELTRPMTESSAPCTCPQGHDDTVKLLSTVSVGGLASGRSAGLSGSTGSSGGGCCGGACGCR